jgi:hypothetical protein
VTGRAMHVEIDEARREIISAKIYAVLRLGLPARGATGRMPMPQFGNFPTANNDFAAFTDAIRKNATRVSKDHLSVGRDSAEPTNFASTISWLPV